MKRDTDFEAWRSRDGLRLLCTRRGRLPAEAGDGWLAPRPMFTPPQHIADEVDRRGFYIVGLSGASRSSIVSADEAEQVPAEPPAKDLEPERVNEPRVDKVEPSDFADIDDLIGAAEDTLKATGHAPPVPPPDGRPERRRLLPWRRKG